MKKNIIELKNLFNSINMPDEADEIELILSAPLAIIQEEINYLRTLKEQTAQAERTTEGDTYLMYRHRRQTLTKIMELIYLA